MGVSMTSSPRIPVYSTADSTSRAAITTMLTGDLCLQLDTSKWYYYTGSAWELTQNLGLKLIEHKTLTGTAKTTTFSSISGYTYVLLIGQIYTDSGTADTLGLQFNADTGNNYDYSYVSTATYGNATGQARIAFCSGGTSSTSATSFNVLIPINSAASDHICLGESLTTGQTNQKLAHGGNWNNAAAITSIKIDSVSSNGNLIGTASLYGVQIG